MTSLTRTIVGFAGLGLAACGAEPAVESPEYDDVAQMLASSLSSDSGGGLRGAIEDATRMAFGDVPAGFSRDRFGWLSGRHGDATYTFQLTCSDAGGRMLPACDARTNHATVIAAWSGAIHVVGYTSRFNRTALWELDHLQSGLGTLSGVSQLGGTASFGLIGTPSTYELVTTFHDHHLLDTAARSLMASEETGTLAMTHNGGRFDLEALITIDVGATTAAISLDGNFVRETNLDTSFPGE